MSYKPGGHYAICDRCGAKVRHHDTRKEYTGFRVCADGCLDRKHPQEFVRGRPDDQRVHDARPEPTDSFLSTNEVTANSL